MTKKIPYRRKKLDESDTHSHDEKFENEQKCSVEAKIVGH